MAQNTNRGCSEPCICSICGSNTDQAGIPFGLRNSNLVYMDKVYSLNHATACPILYALTEGTEWVTNIDIGNSDGGRGCSDGCNGNNNGCRCGCNCGCGCECTLAGDAVFNITRSYVVVNSLVIDGETLGAEDVTVDGIAVDSLIQTGNRYTATTDNLITQVNRKRCSELGLPSKNFFLITGAGPWLFNGTIVIEGTVNTGGRTCCFELRFSTPDEGVTITGLSTFAVPDIALPCAVNGVAPVIEFGFTGEISILNPGITVMVNDNTVALGITGSLAVQPEVSVQVVRRTLFSVDARESLIPCDGFENPCGETIEDCTCEGSIEVAAAPSSTCSSCSW